MKLIKKFKQIVCIFIGHSNIQEGCMGYFHCGRCDAFMGDSLAGCYKNDKIVIIRHNCKICKKNYKRLTWKDKLFVPNPFKVKQ